MPIDLITSTMKSEPGRETNALPRMLASGAACAAFASAAWATLVAAAIAAPAAAAPFRKVRRFSPDSSSGARVDLRSLLIGVSSSDFPVRCLPGHLSKTGESKTVPPGRKWPAFRQMESPRPSASIRARQLKHVLGEVAQDEIGRDRRDLVQARLAELALDVVLLGEAESAVGLQAHVARLPRGFRRELLRHVRFRTTGLVALVELRGALDHERGGLGRHVGARDRELHALVLADRPA